ncbi:MAG: AAA-like domain-containing protein [Acidobacteriaceae bacterium]
MSTVEIPRETKRSFFTVGGTLPANAPSYVERKADTDLFTHLMEGQFCYVLTSRQVGKSSLMVRTAIRLREAGRRVAVLDLTKVGMNLSAAQWYDGLLVQLGREFDLEDELDDFWTGTDSAVQRMGPMQRWMTALRKVILPSISGHLVIFIDEIDAVRGLPFATDEFFAGIRQVYNNRTEDPELNRLTFCLIGVATPADLIRNVSTTPFNIGNRVVLTDFTETEAEPLIHGLGREPVLGFKLLRRILWWTNGHPYLTQRLCAAVAADPKVTSPKDVDRICDDLFLSARARESDDNLLFVRERVLRKRSEAELSGLLDLYGVIHAGKQVAADDNNPLIDILRLAGLVTVRDNRLVVRNRIYEHVFDDRWIRMNMPDAELRRQRAAYQKGVMRTVALAAVVLVVIAGLILWNQVYEQKVAFQNYSAHVIQVQQSFDSGDYASGVEGLREAQGMVRTEPHWIEREIDKSQYLTTHLMPFIIRHPWLYTIINLDHKVEARFEWNYLRARLFGDGAYYYMGHRDEVRSVAVSQNGAWLATGSADSTVRIFDISGFNAASTHHPLLKCALAVIGSQATAEGKDSYLYLSGESPDSWSVNAKLDGYLNSDLHLASPAQSMTSDAMTKHGLKPWNPPGILSVAFSPDNAWLAIGTGTWNATQTAGTVYLVSTASLCSGPVQVHQIPTKNELSPSGSVITRVPQKAVDRVVFRNNQEFASTGEDNAAEFWLIQPDGSLRQAGSIDASASSTKGMNAAAFSPKGHTFAMAFGDGHFCTVPISDAGEPMGGCTDPVVADVSGLMSLAWYPNQLDNIILLGTRDGRVVRADLQKDKTWKFSTFLDTGQGLVTSLTFSHDGKLLLTTGSDGTVQVWNMLQDEHDPTILAGYGSSQMLRGAKVVVYSAAITLHQRLIVSGGADTISGATDGRVYFWARQPEPDGALNPEQNKKTLETDPADLVVPPSTQVVCGGLEHKALIQPSWASQTPFIRTCGSVQSLAYSPGGERIAALVGVTQGDNLKLEKKDGERPATLIIQRLAVGPVDAAHLNDPNHGSPLPRPEKPVGEPVLLAGDRTSGVALAWSGKYLAAAENDKSGYCGTVQLWDMSGNSPLPVTLAMPPELLADSSQRADCRADSKQHNTLQSLAFLRDGTLVAGLNQSNAGHSKAILVFWNPAQSLQKWARLPFADLHVDGADHGFSGYPENFSLTALAFSADSRRMAVCGVANSVQVWNLPAGLWNAGINASSFRRPRNLTGTEYASSDHASSGLQGQCSAVTFSPDGNWLAAGTRSYDVAVWSTSNWTCVQGDAVKGSLIDTNGETAQASQIYYPPAPPMANAAINTITFSPDTRRLAYGTADSKIILWHVVAQDPLPVINVHSGGVLSLAFSPNGLCLASGSSDQTLRFTCEVDPKVLEKLQRINFTSKPPSSSWIGSLGRLFRSQSAGGTGIPVPASDRPERDNWVQYAQ